MSELEIQNFDISLKKLTSLKPSEIFEWFDTMGINATCTQCGSDSANLLADKNNHPQIIKMPMIAYSDGIRNETTISNYALCCPKCGFQRFFIAEVVYESITDSAKTEQGSL